LRLERLGGEAGGRGWWALRNVAYVKYSGQSSLTDELNTTLISIEAAVNSRPITQSGDSDVLTPGHFLIGGSLITISTGSEPETRKDLAKESRVSAAGRDHKVRTVFLRTPEGRRFRHPVQLVVPLEIDKGGEDVKE
jgi:hypothetical protein